MHGRYSALQYFGWESLGEQQFGHPKYR